ncbi:MAG TPA: hypothetical protein VN822_08580 [Candidatus Acidoferrales bacterium]|nr:hypothetical protein [Candidatus Acidoferrales bacterium]
MRYLKLLAVLGVFLIPASYAQAQRVAIGIGIGGPAYVGPAYVGPAPVCDYGYYDYSPYACAPYGYYGPSWFSSGVFIGAGPWFHGFYGRPGFRPFVGGGRGFGPGFRRDFDDRGRGWGGRGPAGGFHGGGGFHSFNGGGSFHGGGNFHGGGSFHGGGGSHGGGGGSHGGGGFHGGGRR